MNHDSIRTLTFPAVVFACLSATLAAADAPGKVTIYRDNWGVPHIYADTPAAGAYGLGYAQAEDRLDDIFQAVRTGLGRMSEYAGESYIDQDYIMRLVRNEEMAQKQWEHASEPLRELATSFVAGVKAYIEDHPDDAPESKLDLEPWQIATIGRAMILRWPLGTIQDEVERRPKGENVSMRSNQWAVSPTRSADGSAILLADPHLTWESLALLYEARVHAGPLEMCGFFLIGTPLMGYGHNANVGWALTTGGPDTADVYVIKTRMGLIPQYEYDGQWKACRLSAISIPVKGRDPEKRPAMYTHLGPVVVAPNKEGVAYVAATPYFDSADIFEQFYRMNTASDANSLHDALGMNEFNEQNVMFADTKGNIGYVRTGRVPVRPKGHDWSKPVPGHTSATAWQGIHSIDDLVQIMNPPQGYMQNCNISPANMMVDSPLKPEKYIDYIYNVSWDVTNPRGERITQLLHDDDSVTREDAMAFATDVFDINAAVWKQALRQAVAGESSDSELAKVAQAILDWDGRFTRDAVATNVYAFWREKCDAQVDGSKVFDVDQPDAAELARMRDLLKQTVTEMKERYGRWDLPWGEIHKLGRGERFVPVGGMDFGSKRLPHGFSESLFDVRTKEVADKPGTFVANPGTMSPILMFFTNEGVESFSCVCWGQSGHADSPHYMDQGEQL
ncbi:MAG: penicillin acylase family protein, partial [Pirellulales bacterium]